MESLFLAGLPTIESVHRNIPYASYYPLIAPFFDHPSLIASYEFFVAPFNTDPKFGALTLITFAGLLYATIGILPPAAPSPSA